jgi:hypothetical protein
VEVTINKPQGEDMAHVKIGDYVLKEFGNKKD